jgi:SAM-dependent methyltransferase
MNDTATYPTEHVTAASSAVDHFGEQVAARYDERAAEMFDPAVVGPAVDFLAGFAQGGAALELGIGTGRIALPLASCGIEVQGIDLSEAMVAKLREKPGGDRIPVTIGDFSSTRVEGSFRLVYLVFNSIPNLTSQAEQVACFRNAAAHLEPGGRFVIEVRVPGVRWLPPGQTIRAFHLDEHYVGIDEYEPASQRMTSHHYRLDGGKVELHSIPFRYVWPSELDLMAQLAGMTLHERWADWTRQPFTAESTAHVSVWEHEG